MSDLIIKGMEMPKDCGHCQFKYINMSGYVICEMLHKQIVLEQFGARFDHCPLVEVPTPHGRLIDADKLAKDTIYNKYITETILSDAPTVIEAERSEE